MTPWYDVFWGVAGWILEATKKNCSNHPSNHDALKKIKSVLAGVNGIDGDGDIMKSTNLEEFQDFVLASTDDKGVHFVMADGVRILIFKNPLLLPEKHIFQKCLSIHTEVIYRFNDRFL